MKLTEDRVSHLAHIMIDAMYNDDLVDYPDDDDQEALRAVKRVFGEYLKIETEAAEVARKKVLSQSRSVLEGSREYDVLFRKYLEEEIGKKTPGW